MVTQNSTETRELLKLYANWFQVLYNTSSNLQFKFSHTFQISIVVLELHHSFRNYSQHKGKRKGLKKKRSHVSLFFLIHQKIVKNICSHKQKEHKSSPVNSEVQI